MHASYVLAFVGVVAAGYLPPSGTPSGYPPAYTPTGTPALPPSNNTATGYPIIPTPGGEFCSHRLFCSLN